MKVENPTRKDNGANAPSTQLQILIVYDQLTGQMQVTGAISNSLVAFGMLELAKDVVKKFIEANQSPIVRPSSGLSLQ